VAAPAAYLFASLGIPEADGAVVAAGQDSATVGRKGNAVDPTAMAREPDNLVRRPFPHKDGTTSRGGRSLSVWSEDNSVNIHKVL
jgi:hypothetical protein